jgi:biopolymer transport protein ExbB
VDHTLADFLDPSLLTAWVLYTLILMSLASAVIFVERIWYLRKATSPMGPLVQSINRFSDGGEFEAFRKGLDGMTGFEARNLAKVMGGSSRNPDKVEESLEALTVLDKISLERRLTVIGTVGANAPFVGLLGTVLGVMKAFRDLARMEGAGLEVVGMGISEALVATALGLLVAILAVVAYNYLQKRVKTLVARANSLNTLVVARLREP